MHYFGPPSPYKHELISRQKWSNLIKAPVKYKYICHALHKWLLSKKKWKSNVKSIDLILCTDEWLIYESTILLNTTLKCRTAIKAMVYYFLIYDSYNLIKGQTLTVKWRTEIKARFYFFNLCMCVMLDSVSFLFKPISFLMNSVIWLRYHEHMTGNVSFYCVVLINLSGWWKVIQKKNPFSIQINYIEIMYSKTTDW